MARWRREAGFWGSKRCENLRRRGHAGRGLGAARCRWGWLMARSYRVPWSAQGFIMLICSL
jgi:hypothetical protein